MKSLFWMRVYMVFLLTVVGITVTGCGSSNVKGPEPGNQVTPTVDSSDVAVNWCVEHGVPEDICALCNAKLATDYKQKGDWCKEHNRPESQCFLCNPKLQDKFAAEYEAKNGKKPPKPEEM